MFRELCQANLHPQISVLERLCLENTRYWTHVFPNYWNRPKKRLKKNRNILWWLQPDSTASTNICIHSAMETEESADCSAIISFKRWDNRWLWLIQKTNLNTLTVWTLSEKRIQMNILSDSSSRPRLTRCCKMWKTTNQRLWNRSLWILYSNLNSHFWPWRLGITPT